MKKLKEIILTTLIITAMTTSTYAGTNNIYVTVDGQAVTFTDTTPYVDANGRTMMPVAKIVELLNVSVDWNGTSQTVTLKGDGKEVVLKINDDNITVDGVTSKMDTKAVIKDGRTYVPLSAIAKAFGVTTGWDKATSTVSLKNGVAISEKEDSVTDNANTKDIVNGEEVKLTAELTKIPYVEEKIVQTEKGESTITSAWPSVGFKVSSNNPVMIYQIAGRTEYFEANQFTAEELKEMVDNIEKDYHRSFENEDIFGSYIDRYGFGTETTLKVPDSHCNGENYSVKIFGVTETGEISEIVTLDFTTIVKYSRGN